ncbi:hypothetical protein [Parasphaerochaeta coccoides]|uniref:Uncharacterized protein n=1 Tax=Parasphaerochaeta coccoides (strain ATCC BAA-1237 / DSM 17374 / SPN1) TaxID=760011 RepID=F4GL40_PARC1|nr:hypothetical protein [Parasphaerochaeta coccoides]AEC02380.1 hypothetical protein Spico_1166 [Parasphaerochaeta coccoides DSM 17374]
MYDPLDFFDSDVYRKYNLRGEKIYGDYFGQKDQEARAVTPLLQELIDSSPDPSSTATQAQGALLLSKYMNIPVESGMQMMQTGQGSSLANRNTDRKSAGESFLVALRNAWWQDRKGIATTKFVATGDDKWMKVADDFNEKLKKNRVFEDYNVLGDLFVASAQPLYSGVKFALEDLLIKGGVSLLTGGVGGVALTAGQILAKAFHVIESGSSQAGNDYYDMYHMEDANGERLDMTSPLAKGLFVLDVLVQGGIEVVGMEWFPGYKHLNKLITPNAFSKAAKQSMSGYLKEFGAGWIKGLVGESLEEGGQSVVSDAVRNILTDAANKNGADFEGIDIPQMARNAGKAMWEGAKGMVLSGLVTGGIGETVYARRMNAEANKSYAKEDGSSVVDRRYILNPDTSPVESAEPQSTGKMSPPKVYKGNGVLIPASAEDARKISTADRQGTRAARVQVIDIPQADGNTQAEQINTMALHFGSRLSGNTLVFESQEDFDAARDQISRMALETRGNEYDIMVDNSKMSVSLALDDGQMESSEADASILPTVEVPYRLSTMSADRAIQAREREMVEEAIGDLVSHTQGRISRSDMDANVDAVLAVGQALKMNTDDLLKNHLTFTLDTEIPAPQKDKVALGFLERPSLVNGKPVYTVHISKKADASTLPHEVLHFMRPLVPKELMAPFVKAYGGTDGEMWLEDIKERDGKFYLGKKEFSTYEEALDVVRPFEERFAEDGTGYLGRGIAPIEEMKPFFERFKAALKALVEKFKDRLSADVIQAFDRLFSEDGTAENRAGRAVELFQQESSLTPQEAQRQYTEVETRYRGTDLWMKAPNGKPTNLTERQWVTVRTPAFKEWFGDWEASALMEGKPIASVSSHDIHIGDRRIIDAAKKWIQENPVGNAETVIGTVIIDETGVQNSMSHKPLYPNKVFVLPVIKRVLEQGAYLGKIPHINQEHFTSHFFIAPVELDGERKYVFIRVREKEGDANYFYVHNVYVDEDIKRLEAALTGPAEKSATGASNLKQEIARIFANVKNFSRVIDSNGEPLVAYHATDNESTPLQSGNSAGTIYLGFDEKSAKRAAHGKRDVIPVFLSVKNPVNEMSSGIEQHDAESPQKVAQWRDAGHDGVYVHDESGTGIAVFDPGQIKSATDTFDPDNPDIPYQEDFPNVLFQTASVRMDVPFNENEGGESRVYALAEESRTEFSDTVRAMAAAFHLPDDAVMFRPDLKGVERARVKVAQDYGGDWGRLLDINGAMLVFEESGDAQAAYERILKEHADIVAREKKKDTDFGYKDFTVNIRMSNGFIGEVQLLGKAIFHAKETGGHLIYAEARKLEKYSRSKEKYTALFGKDITERIDRLYESLKAWSVEVYSSKGFEYDKPGLSAKASATLRESRELSSLLRSHIPPSRSVGFLSMTDLPSGEGTSTASKKNPPSSVLMGISQISKYLTAIESSSALSIPNSQESDKISTDGEAALYQLSDEAKEEILNQRENDVQHALGGNYYVPTSVVDEYAAQGKEWAVKEMNLRSMINASPELLKRAREYQTSEDFMEAMKNDPKVYDRDFVDEHVTPEDWMDADEYFFGKVYAYAHLKSRDQRDRLFVNKYLSSDKKLLELVTSLRVYSDVDTKYFPKRRKPVYTFVRARFGAFPGVSPYVLRLKESSSPEEFARARQAIMNNPRAYRNALLVVEQANYRVATRITNSEDGNNAYATANDVAAYLEEVGEDVENELFGTHYADEPLVESVDMKPADGPVTQTQIDAMEADSRIILDRYMVQAAKDKAGLQRQIKTVRKRAEDAKSKVREISRELTVQKKKNQRIGELRAALKESRAEEKKQTAILTALQRKLEAHRLKEARSHLFGEIKKSTTWNENTMDAAYIDDMQMLQAMVDPKNRSRKQIKDWRKDGDVGAVPEHLSQYVGDVVRFNRPINDWSISELQELREAAKLLAMDARAALSTRNEERMGRLRGYASAYYRQTYGKDVDWDELISELVKTEPEHGKDNAWEVVRNSFGKIQRLARKFDGNREGVLYDLFARQSFLANQQEQSHVTRRLEASEKKMEELGMTTKHLREKIFSYKTSAGQDVEFTRDQVMGMYIYQQNEFSLEKLIREWGNNIPIEKLSEAINLLSGNDKAWAEYMMSELGGDEAYNRMYEVFYRVYNEILGRRDKYFTWVSEGNYTEGNTDVLIGPDSKKVRYTDKGMTKAVKPHAKYKMRLDVTNIYTQQVRRQEHFMAWAEWVRDTHYLLGQHGSMGAVLEYKYGKGAKDQIQAYVNDAGSPNFILDDLDRMYNTLLSNSAAAVLAYNAMTPIKQLASLSFALRGDISPVEFLKASRNLVVNHEETMESIYAKAPELKASTFDVEILRFHNQTNKSGFGRFMGNVNTIGLKGVEFVDQAVKVVLWQSGYTTFVQRNTEKYRKTGEGWEARLEAEAVYRASQIVAETQSSSSVTDLAKVQRSKNPWLRTAIMFTNDIFQQLNMVYYDMPFYFRQKNWRKLAGTAVGLGLSWAFMALAKGVLFGDDDDKEKDFAIEIGKNIVQSLVPYVGPQVSQGMEGWSSTGLIGLPFTSGLFLLGLANGDENLSKKLWNAVRDAGKTLAIPTTAIQRTFNAVKDGNPLEMFGSDYGDLWGWWR